MDLAELESATSRLSAERSNQLSYRSITKVRSRQRLLLIAGHVQRHHYLSRNIIKGPPRWGRDS